jgi:hypothetical protein
VSYKLTKLASGSYDVWRNGVIIASLVRNGSTSNAPWTVELLADFPQGEVPEPFTAPEHTFGSLEEAWAWLDTPEAGSSTRGEG